MPLVQTRGAASAQGFGEFAQQTAVNYIEDVFSCFPYTGNSSTQTITNNIDLSTKGGLVWIKDRNAANPHFLTDTARGTSSQVSSNSTAAATTNTNMVTAFSSTGFTLGSSGDVNNSTNVLVSWTFRKQPKFFDIITYTGNGTSPRQISHNLGSTPGCVMIKKTSGAANWQVWNRGVSSPAGAFGVLNDTLAFGVNSDAFYFSNPTSTYVTVGSADTVNTNGATYVMYLFAHDAGGFGLTGLDNVISCGAYTGNGGSQDINLGYEPQWLLIKRATNADANAYWAMEDIMRGGLTAKGNVLQLRANSSQAEDALGGVTTGPRATATGFQYVSSALAAYNGNGETYIYIAIRRGPMKVPTTGTSVYQADYRNATAPAYTSGFPVDLVIDTTKSGDNRRTSSRLQGAVLMQANSTIAETSDSSRKYDYMDGWSTDTGASTDYLSWMFKRAPSFMDVVCYTGNNVSGRTITHNLAAVPQLMIVKSRTSATRDWIVYDATNGATKYMNLNNNSASGAGSFWVSTAPTSTVFTVSDSASVNDPAQNYVAYLFATCAGVSKVGSYSGTGALQTVNCGFTSGARFVLIKRTDSTGDWWTYDSLRGISSGNDPYLFLNNTTAEVTSTNYVDTDSTGFKVTAAAPAGLNANGGTYIFLAIA